MAERLPEGNMQALQQFVNQPPWEWAPVWQRIAQRLCETVLPEAWGTDAEVRRDAVHEVVGAGA
ncbi:transposase [Streptomyces sp. NPDC023327]|uniref:transposase n=1 Tax=Streptomyces sp. NPDC023327 TaxID=3157088 RepID=UPI0033F28A78